ncbi:MAG TPA: c-type cytochrome [Azonexus sp.]
MRHKSGFGFTVCALLAALALLPVGTAAAAGFQVCDSHGLVRGAEIAMERGCFGCHTLSSKRVGPPYREIAAKYEREPTALATLANKIKNGGSGVWGAATMPANPISDEEAEILARWIQSL